MYNTRLYFIVVYLFISIIYCQNLNLDVNHVKAWGPGLTPDKIVMPARYFFIDSSLDYDRIKSHLPLFKVKVAGLNIHNINCRVWLNILDRKDGSFIVRYKLYETCFNFNIEITYHDEHVAESPYNFNSTIFHDNCDCAEESFAKWSQDFQCKATYIQIERDLIPFTAVNLTEIRPKILALYNKPTSYSICNYVIIENKIYRKCYGKYVGFNIFMDNILLSLSRKVRLPNLELFVNLGDWPLAPRNKQTLPIFSWCGSDDSYDIVMPTYDVTESTLENMGRVMLDMLSVQGNIKYPWPEKIPKVFWRGRDSNKRRLELIDISREHFELFNVSLTNFFFFRNDIEKYGPKTEHVSFFSFFDYKYQLNMDGTVAAYRFPYLLAGDSLVLKQDSKYYEWFYKSLKTGVHFLGVKEDLSNLVAQVKWAMENDEQAKKIALNGQKFARDNLMPRDIFCYYAVLLQKWSERISSPIEILEDMELVPQREEEETKCNCNQISNKLKDEL